jgi:hypothetical protein
MSSTTLSPVEQASRRPPYRLSREVVLIPVADGSARLLDMQGDFFALSEVAAHMLRDTLELGPGGAAESIARRWGEDVQRVRADLDLFLAELLREGLLVRVDQPDRKPGLGQRLAGAVVSALVRLARLRRTPKGKAAGLLTLAHLSCRWLGWAQTVRLWQRLFAPPATGLLDGHAAEEARRTIDEAVRHAVAQSALAHACKERGLASWALARSAGLPVRLVIGLSLCPLHGHCWAQFGTTFLGDDPERCAEYQPVRTYE